MTANDNSLWAANIPINTTTSTVLFTVAAMDNKDRSVGPAFHTGNYSYKSKKMMQDGSDRASVGAWPENGILGTQLGPNRNAKTD